MSMMDFYTIEQALEALEEAKETKKIILEHLDNINQTIFILDYFLKTGEPLNPEAFDFTDPEEEEDDD